MVPHSRSLPTNQGQRRDRWIDRRRRKRRTQDNLGGSQIDHRIQGSHPCVMS